MEDGKRKRGIVAAGTSVLLVISWLIAWDNADALQRRVCVKIGVTRAVAQRSGQCSAKYQSVSSDEATAAFDTFLSSLTLRRDKGWTLLSGAARSASTREDHIKKWTGTIGAERVGPLSPSPRFNTFSAVYRIYATRLRAGEPNFQSASGTLDERQTVVRFERDEDEGVLIARVLAAPRTANLGRSVRLARATFRVDTRTVRRPGSSNPVFPDVRAGTSLRFFCAYRAGSDVWYHSYGGWFPSTQVDVDQRPSDGTPTCQPPPPESDPNLGGR